MSGFYLLKKILLNHFYAIATLVLKPRLELYVKTRLQALLYIYKNVTLIYLQQLTTISGLGPYPLLSVSLFLAATHHNFFPQSLGNFRFVSLNFSFSIGFIWFFCGFVWVSFDLLVGFVCASFFMIFSMTCFGIVFVSFLYFRLWWHRLDHYNRHWGTCIWLPWRFGALLMEVTIAIMVKEFVKC